MNTIDSLAERQRAYENRCCDWHWGDSGGRGDPNEGCRGMTYPDRRIVVRVNGREASVRERDVRFLSLSATDTDHEKLKVRISNLEWMNENLRENNRALLETNESLRDVVAKLSNPTITVGGQ